MARNAFVARTAHDQQHINHLAIPAVGIKSLVVKAGNKKSKTYFPEGSFLYNDIKNDGVEDFNFAPGYQVDKDSWNKQPDKVDKVEIIYRLENPTGAIKKLKFEIFTRFSEQAIWRKEVSEAKHLPHDKDYSLQFADGDKGGEWDGKIAGADKNKFPDEYLTTEHSPYKLKVTVEGAGVSYSQFAWTYFYVQLAKVELEYGDEKMLPAPQNDKGDHRKVFKDLKTQGDKPPTDGQLRKVYLESNLYKSDSNQMFDNTLFDEYKNCWEKGTEIPLLAKVFIKSSDGKEVICPQALGKTKFLWDWESKSQLPTNGFIKNSMDYHKESTKPKGYNCHKERGGKRADDDNHVFPAQAGYEPKDALDDGKFPFKVEKCDDPRKWAAISYAWTDKKLAGKTGVIFQPARTAGDRYTVTLYVAYDIDKDKKITINTDKDAPLLVPDILKAKTGEFEIWRKQTLKNYYRKNSLVQGLNLGTICGSYEEAFLKTENDTGGPTDFEADKWNQAVEDVRVTFSARDQLFWKPKSEFDQHAAGPKGLYVRTRDDFFSAWLLQKLKDDLTSLGVGNAHVDAIANAAAGAANNAAATAQALGYNEADKQTIVQTTNQSRQFIQNQKSDPTNGMDTNQKHAKKMENYAVYTLKKVFDTKFDDKPGIRIFHVGEGTNLRHLQGGYLLGLAYDFPNAKKGQCGFLLLMKPNDVACGAEKISAHEIGHHMFLPHPPDTAECNDYKAHDIAHTAGGGHNCLMSYNYNQSMTICGFCQLRLRGWDKSKLDPDGTLNKQV